MLAVTRTWNAVCSISAMRRGLALAGDYARRRTAFGALLADKPLHADTLAALEAEYAAAFCLAFRSVELLGMLEHRTDSPEREVPERRSRDEQDDRREREALERLSRVVIPIAKLVTGKQAVAVTSEAIEACGGAGYVEDTGLPRVLADAQVLPIWEGTTNVLSLDTLRALGKGGALEALHAELERNLGAASDPELARPSEVARAAMRHAMAWAQSAMPHVEQLEAGARRLAMTLGRSLSLALLVGHAQWCLDHGFGPRTAAAARRFAMTAVDQITDAAFDDTRLLSARA